MNDPRRSGLALLVVTGVLGILALLAVAFLTLSRLERRASAQRVHASQALLLARSGVEDALARLSAGQASAYGGEDWDASGTLNGLEASAEILHPGLLDVETCPVREALRPSFFVRDPASLGADGRPAPKRLLADSRERGFSGALRTGTPYAVKSEDLNGRIHVNGGVLDALDRDPDGPNALPEASPLSPNGVPDHRDFSPEGPNGFLRRLLDGLELVVLGTNATPSLGVLILQNRPAGGYGSLQELKPVLGTARYATFRPFLTVHAWVDPKVVKPQPPDVRPHRFLDIDDVHRVGKPTANPTLAGIPTQSGISGSGTQASPWTQTLGLVTFTENRTYPLSWERNAIYAWRQLRLAPPALEPRAPVSINTASREVLAAVLLGLKGTHLETWEGSAGWDGGFGWGSSTYGGPPAPSAQYAYPSPGAEETPWIRTRADYGMEYGTGTRPWYGPTAIDPSQYPNGSGPSLAGSGRLGRLRECAPVSVAQAKALADQIRARVLQKGAFASWTAFDAFVDALPGWEDANLDGLLDGGAYDVTGTTHVYQRRAFHGEDLDSDGILNNQTFTAKSGTWLTGIAWADAATDPLGVPGLTAVQKDVIRAMANPNTRLNDLNPDANLWKQVDKTDVAGLGSVMGSGVPAGDPLAYAHTTEFCLDPPGLFRVSAAGRILSPKGRVEALRERTAYVKAWEPFRDTAQADFMRDYNPGAQGIARIFSKPPVLPPYPMSGNQHLVSYPEPQTLPGGIRAADSSYDGQIGLGLVGTLPGPDERLRGDLFLDLNASATTDPSDPDVRGPFHARLSAAAGTDPGNLFPDGLYSEKDAALKFPMAGNIQPGEVYDFWDQLTISAFYVGAWVKPNWFPEATPRPHALISLSPYHKQIQGHILFGGGYKWNPYGFPIDIAPLDHIPSQPVGCYYVPARNNYAQAAPGTYNHDVSSSRGRGWPRRSLLWGSTHCLFASETVNVRGLVTQQAGSHLPAQTPLPASRKPLGRIQGHRWVHVAVTSNEPFDSPEPTWMVLGGRLGSANGGGWNHGMGYQQHALSLTHDEPGGATSPNHLRFGEVAAENNMNWTADATIANVQQGNSVTIWPGGLPKPASNYKDFFLGVSSPARVGRYLKEDGAAFVSPRLPAWAVRPLRVTWTEIPADLWFDQDGDGWLGDAADFFVPLNDRFGPGGSAGPDGRRDVRIDLEVWDDRGTVPVGDDVKLGTFRDAEGENPLLPPFGKLYYKAVFVNDWDDPTRMNFPLDVTPFLDDVTFTLVPPGGPSVLAWEEDAD